MKRSDLAIQFAAIQNGELSDEEVRELSSVMYFKIERMYKLLFELERNELFEPLASKIRELLEE